MLFRSSFETGMPIMRHMFLHHPGDKEALTIEDQFFFGEDILVAPVMDDVDARDVYLPEGDWVNLWSGEVVTGAKWLRGVDAPLNTIPLFGARDAEIPVRVYPEQREENLRLAGDFSGLRDCTHFAEIFE